MIEAWITVVVAGIVALSTLGATLIQNWFSSKRFKRELERQKEIDARHRRWEVRGESLLKLRTELARMANKQNRLLDAAHKQHTRFGFTDEEAQEMLREAIDDWNSYVRNGDWLQTFFSLDDVELMNRLGEVLKDYTESYVSAIYWKNISATDMTKAMAVFERNKARIVEIQALINKRLEDL